MDSAKKKRVMIVGAGTFQYPLLERCAQLYDVVIAAPEIPDAYRELAADFIISDVRDYRAIIAALEERGPNPIDGIVTDQTDIPVLTVARIARHFGLPCIDEETAHLFTDKSLMREKLDELGIKTLPHRTVRSLEEATEAFAEIGSAVIIKPVDAQGSRGVQVCHTREDLESKYSEAARWASESSGRAVVVEKLAVGREFVVEGLALDYHFWNLCIGDTKYFGIDDSYSAKERTFPTLADDELRDRVLELNAAIVRGFGLKQGLTHSEFIMDGDDIYLLETAARGGGAFISSDLIPLACGLDTADFLLKVAIGEVSRDSDLPSLFGLQDVSELDTIALNPLKHCAYVAFYIPCGTVLSVEGAEEVRTLPYVHRTQIDDFESLVGTVVSEGHTDKTTRLLVTLEASDRAELEQRMAFIRSTLKMRVQAPDGTICGLIWE